MSNLSVSTNLSEVLEGDLRLDATFYGSSSYKARKILDDFEINGGFTELLGSLTVETFNPPPIKRVYTDSEALGTPYMLPQEMFDFYWEPRKYVIANKMPKIENWFLKENWIVLTQSGSVGKPFFVTKADQAIVLSQNAVRVPLKNLKRAGYVYAYMSTWIGQSLLKKTEFGITVKHIRPQHVDSLPIPKLAQSVEDEISAKIEKAFALRAEAIKLIGEAKSAIYSALDAPTKPPIDEDDD